MIHSRGARRRAVRSAAELARGRPTTADDGRAFASRAAGFEARARRLVSTQPPPVSRRSFRFLSLVFQTLIFSAIFAQPFRPRLRKNARARVNHTRINIRTPGNSDPNRVVFLPFPPLLLHSTPPFYLVVASGRLLRRKRSHRRRRCRYEIVARHEVHRGRSGGDA